MSKSIEEGRFFKTEDNDLMKDIEMCWEEWRGTKEAERVIQLGFFTTIALAFCKYYLKSRGLKKNG